MLNYKQLHHFWTVARAGGIVRAAERSGLAPQTLSGQIATLETDLGVNLFKRQGRGLVLTGYHRESLSRAAQAAMAHERNQVMPLLFVKPWNEWAEGNHLEPDVRFGHGWLEALRDVVLPQG